MNSLEMDKIMSENKPRVILEVHGLTRRFPGVLALNQVDFALQSGEIHALVGENGAGKSTLINILAGVLQPSGGKVLLDGAPVVFHNPSDAQHAGINVIFQEFNLIPHLNVAENIFINREPTRNGRIDWSAMNERAAQALERLEIDIDPRVPVSSLSVAQQQLVEIARALAFDARVIVMDEPTAALSEREVDRLLEIVRTLASGGVGLIYVSHKLEEVFRVADRITILRDGNHILTDLASNLDEEKVIYAMVGRALVHGNCPVRNLGEIVLKVKNLSVEDSVRDVSFELRAGEVLGLAGLMGSGATEVVEALFGLREARADEIVLQGAALAIDNPRNAIHSRLGYVPNDRKKAGLLPDLSVKHNISIGILDRLRKLFWIDRRLEHESAETYQQKLNVRCSSLDQRISNLSGGNQQKVMLARALAEECRVLLLAEPTRGVDVGAKAEIYTLIDALVDAGLAVLLQSSELPEIIRLANRVVVFSSGQPRGELAGADLTQESMMALAIRV
jgi:ABC-type sugar transport system ATPase subunit